MNVTIRKARPADRRYHDWQPYRDDAFPHTRPFTPWVVTVDGIVYLVLETHGRDGVVRVAYQNGSGCIPNLVRMFQRYVDTLPALYDDVRDRKRDRESRETRARYRDAMARAHTHERGHDDRAV